MPGSSARPPAPSTHDGVNSISRGSPAANAAASGAPVSGSAVTTRTPGRSALSALAMPVVSPPPPQGMTTVSNSGASSAISRPIVPLPAITASSAAGATNSPSTPSRPRSTIACHHSSCVTGTSSAPSASTRSSFARGASAGTITRAGTPASRAAQATP